MKYNFHSKENKSPHSLLRMFSFNDNNMAVLNRVYKFIMSIAA